MLKKIVIKGAKEHNLKNVSLEIPKDKLVVITGLSGSGKSSLAFDTIYAEGQRRYVESLSAYARQFLDKMTKSELLAVMTGGMATIAGGVMAAYVAILGQSFAMANGLELIVAQQLFAERLLGASLMAAPAALIIADDSMIISSPSLSTVEQYFSP